LFIYLPVIFGKEASVPTSKNVVGNKNKLNK